MEARVLCGCACLSRAPACTSTPPAVLTRAPLNFRHGRWWSPGVQLSGHTCWSMSRPNSNFNICVIIVCLGMGRHRLTCYKLTSSHLLVCLTSNRLEVSLRSGRTTTAAVGAVQPPGPTTSSTTPTDPHNHTTANTQLDPLTCSLNNNNTCLCLKPRHPVKCRPVANKGAPRDRTTLDRVQDVMDSETPLEPFLWDIARVGGHVEQTTHTSLTSECGKPC